MKHDKAWVSVFLVLFPLAFASDLLSSSPVANIINGDSRSALQGKDTRHFQETEVMDAFERSPSSQAESSTHAMSVFVSLHREWNQLLRLGKVPQYFLSIESIHRMHDL